MDKRLRSKTNDPKSWNIVSISLYISELLVDYNLAWAAAVGLLINFGWFAEMGITAIAWLLYLTAGAFGNLNLTECRNSMKAVSIQTGLKYLVIPFFTHLFVSYCTTVEIATAILIFQISPIGLTSSSHFSFEAYANSAYSVIGALSGLIFGIISLSILNIKTLSNTSIFMTTLNVVFPLLVGYFYKSLKNEKNQNSPTNIMMEKRTEFPLTSTTATIQIVFGLSFMMNQLGGFKNFNYQYCIGALLLYAISALSTYVVCFFLKLKSESCISLLYMSASPPELVFVPMLINNFPSDEGKMIFISISISYYLIASVTSFWVFSWLSSVRIQRGNQTNSSGDSPTAMFSLGGDISQRHIKLNNQNELV